MATYYFSKNENSVFKLAEIVKKDEPIKYEFTRIIKNNSEQLFMRTESTNKDILNRWLKDGSVEVDFFFYIKKLEEFRTLLNIEILLNYYTTA